MYKALKRACKNVRWKTSVTQFELNGLKNTAKSIREIENGKYKLSKYQEFEIYEPKHRHITATRIKDRQIQYQLIETIQQRYAHLHNENLFEYHDTICRLVANRSKHIREFASQHDIILFVSGEKSSNGLYLFDICKQANPRSFFISRIEQLQQYHFLPDESIGICGATSTPMWLMEQIKQVIINAMPSCEN